MPWGKTLAVWLGIVLMMSGPTRAAHPASPVQAEPANGHSVNILVLGDSLSAEYGLPRGSGWVSIIEQRLADREQAYQIRNASISGDTTISGLRRLPSLLKAFPPQILILQLGANDGLRGQPVHTMQGNLQKMIDLGQAEGAKVLLLGQHIPPNYGQRYTQSFHDSYGELARANDIALVPFMLEGIALDPNMFQADGLHPTAKAQVIIADTIWPQLEKLLDN